MDDEMGFVRVRKCAGALMDDWTGILLPVPISPVVFAQK